jgi:dihydropteroate synthase
MGIVNVTPDSFSDGGISSQGPHAALHRAQQLVEQGADILDMGGQSTRPGASPVSVEEEVRRVVPAIRSALLSH